MNEEWKVYKETKSNRYGHRVYEVSNLGRVRLNGEIVEPHMYGNYLGFGKFHIHRAVAQLFIPNPENKPCVDHINTDCLDNRACNLRWVTQAENNRNLLTVKHQSEAQRGKVYSAERNRKISEALKGKHLSEEHKRKISESNKRRPGTFKGKTHTEETKRKMSEALKGRTFSEESKQKMREAWVRRKKRGN